LIATIIRLVYIGIVI